MAMKTNTRSTLCDIPEDKTIDTDDVSSGSSFETLEVCSSSERTKNNNTRFFGNLSHRWKKRPSAAGADVNTLRGLYGSDFEGYAVVCLGASKKSGSPLGGFLGKNNNTSPKERYLLIKGTFCFVFKDEQSSEPKCVIRLAQLKPRVTHASRHMTIVAMKEQTTSTNQEHADSFVEHRFVFLRESHASKFYATVNRMTKQGEINGIQERLGDDLVVLNENKSIRYAEMVAIEQMDGERGNMRF